MKIEYRGGNIDLYKKKPVLATVQSIYVGSATEMITGALLRQARLLEQKNRQLEASALGSPLRAADPVIRGLKERLRAVSGLLMMALGVHDSTYRWLQSPKITGWVDSGVPFPPRRYVLALLLAPSQRPRWTPPFLPPGAFRAGPTPSASRASSLQNSPTLQNSPASHSPMSSSNLSSSNMPASNHSAPDTPPHDQPHATHLQAKTGKEEVGPSNTGPDNTSPADATHESTRDEGACDENSRKENSRNEMTRRDLLIGRLMGRSQSLKKRERQRAKQASLQQDAILLIQRLWADGPSQ